jgi:hypothetical protein
MPGQAHEWRLVTISGRVMSVHKLGDRWRAEVRLGTHDVVVVGQPGSGIASSILTEGRAATITGIVRRPYPSATDRRFAVTPRFPADVRVAGRSDSSGGAAETGPSGGAQGTGPTPGPSQAAPDETAIDADLVELDSLIGRRVRVGGLVVDLRANGFSLDDGTAIGRVILRGEAIERLSLVEPDDALNAIGRVEMTPDGAAVIVDDPGGIVLAGDPVATRPSPETSPSASPASSDHPVGGGLFAGRVAGFGGGPWPVDPGAAGLGTLVAISALSLVVTVLRRAHARRQFAARIAARLVTFAGPSGDHFDGTIAEREPSTNRSA